MTGAAGPSKAANAHKGLLCAIVALISLLPLSGCARSGRDEPPEVVRAREAMVRRLASAGLVDKRMQAAFRQTPRQRFLPESECGDAYTDAPLVTDQGSTACTPCLVSQAMLQMCPKPRHRVLMVNIPSGYPAAVASKLCNTVVVLVMSEQERAGIVSQLDGMAAENVEVHACDILQGWNQKAPYQSVLMNSWGTSTPDRIVEQVDDEGVIVQFSGGQSQTIQVVQVVDREPSASRLVTIPPLSP